MRAIRWLSTSAVAWIRIVAALAATLALVAGIPILLWLFVGNPLPTAIPSWDDFRYSVESGQIDDWTYAKVVACVVWIAWAHLMASLLVELVAAARGAKASAVRGLGATQWMARKLVAQFTLASTLVFQSAAGAAVPALPTLAEVLPVEVADFDVQAAEVIPAEVEGRQVDVGHRDSLWSLAENLFGDGQRWTEIRDANVGRTMPDGTVLSNADFVEIREGWNLIVPGLGEPTGGDLAQGVDATTSHTLIGAWRVEQGDHFWKISADILGTGWGRQPSEEEIRGYWLSMISANREHLISPGNNPDVIYAEQQFEVLLPPLPADELSPDDVYATTPHRLDPLEQFTPIDGRPPPPNHREQPAERDDDGEGEARDEEVPADEEAEDPSTSADPAIVPSTPPASADTSNPESNSVAVGSAIRPDPTVLLGIFGTAVGGGLLLRALRHRRRGQAARRRPEVDLEPPAREAAAFEDRIRPVSDTEAVRWLEATNQLLSHRLSEDSSLAMPALVAMRAGELGVELLLDERCEPPAGFIDVGVAGTAWRVDPDLELRFIENEAVRAFPYSPALLPVGETEAGDLLIDVGHFGVVGIAGDDDTIVGWMRSLAVAASSASWARGCEVVAIGVDQVLERIDQVTIPDDPIGWAERTVNEVEAEVQRHNSSPYERRVTGLSAVPHTIVLVGPGFDGVAQHLAAAGELAHSAFTVIGAAPLSGDARIDMHPERAVIEPLGLDFRPTVTEAPAVVLGTSLIEHASDMTSIPMDVMLGHGDGSAEPDLTETQRSVFDAPDELVPDLDEVGLEPAPPAMPMRPMEESGVPPMPFDTLRTDLDAAVPQPGSWSTEFDSEMWPNVDEVDVEPEPLVAEVADVDEVDVEPEPLVAEVADVDEVDVEPEPLVAEASQGALDLRSGAPETVGYVPSADFGEEQSTVDLISEILARMPVEVSVLKPVPTVEGTAEALTPKVLSVLAYLGFHRSTTSERLREVFWPSSVARSTCDNAVSLLRRVCGVSADGERRIGVVKEGKLQVSGEIACDWSRADTLIGLSETAKGSGRTADEMAYLRAALALIEGEPAADAPPKHWGWLRDDAATYTRVETRLVNAAHRLGELCCEAELAQAADWAASQGLLVVPGQEALFCVQMKAAAIDGDDQRVDACYRAAQRSAGSLSEWDDVHPETAEVYARLKRRDRGVAQDSV